MWATGAGASPTSFRTLAPSRVVTDPDVLPYPVSYGDGICQGLAPSKAGSWGIGREAAGWEIRWAMCRVWAEGTGGGEDTWDREVVLTGWEEAPRELFESGDAPLSCAPWVCTSRLEKPPVLPQPPRTSPHSSPSTQGRGEAFAEP